MRAFNLPAILTLVATFLIGNATGASGETQQQELVGLAGASWLGATIEELEDRGCAVNVLYYKPEYARDREDDLGFKITVEGRSDAKYVKNCVLLIDEVSADRVETTTACFPGREVGHNDGPLVVTDMSDAEWASEIVNRILGKRKTPFLPDTITHDGCLLWQHRGHSGITWWIRDSKGRMAFCISQDMPVTR